MPYLVLILEDAQAKSYELAKPAVMVVPVTEFPGTSTSSRTCARLVIAARRT